MQLKPWYKVVTPRADLREGRPLDASEFAVHLDKVRDGQAPIVYQDPAQFFDRTYLTRNLRQLAAEVVRRLSGIKVETNAVFNLATQFGGGKTHALTLLYHLAQGGPQAAKWKGVPAILEEAELDEVPRAATAVFVGTEFDSLAGRGGTEDEPLRQTPWGEIAWQLGGESSFAVVAPHDAQLTAPGGDVIARMLPSDRPVLILMDELMNYVSRSRKSGLGNQFYTFLHNLSETVRGRDDAVLVVSIPASELEMSAEDQSDFERLKKLLDRLGKAMLLSTEGETAEIIRRRLFEWGGLPPEARRAVGAYAAWIREHRSQLPSWVSANDAREIFEASYPFHPSVLSVFERKWQALPRFQRTRGVLRLLALWVSHAYTEGYKGAHKDPLITLGTAPLEDPVFRAAVFEQLGETRLEVAVTTDIAGKQQAHALRLDQEAPDTVRKARLHRKVATAIFFESNGGQQRGEATLAEIRLAVGEPDLDIGSIEQCLEALVNTCYYLSAQNNRYRFSFKPNLNKILADRRAIVSDNDIRDRVQAVVREVFSQRKKVDLYFFPDQTNQVPDRPALALVVMDPENDRQDPTTLQLIEKMAREAGTSARTFKSALIWCVAEDGIALAEEARRLIAWEIISEEASELQLDEGQLRQLRENLQRAQRDLREAVWRAYKNVFLLDEENKLRHIDLGLIHSSSADSIVSLILQRLKDEDLLNDESVSPAFLVRHWPPALPEWSTKGVRDAFFASPLFPRLLDPEAVRRTIARGVEAGLFAYVTKAPDGTYTIFKFREHLPEGDIEIADDVYLIRKENAETYLEQRQRIESGPLASSAGTEKVPVWNDGGVVAHPAERKEEVSGQEGGVTGFRWSGELTPHKWMNFYTRVLAPFVNSADLKISLTVEVKSDAGLSPAKLEEIKVALRGMGLNEELDTDEQ